MQEDLSRLSSADIRRFEKTVSEAKALTTRQEEIAKKVLATEKDIGKIRLASLNEYFDTYSKGLDEIIARKTSQLNDAFLIMEQKATESFMKAADDAEKAASSKRKARASKTKSNNASDGGQEHTNNKQATRRVRNSGNGNQPPKTPNKSSGGSFPPEEESVDVYQTNDDEKTAKLGKEANTTKDIVEKLAAFNAKNRTAEEQINAIRDRSAKKQAESVVSLIELEDLHSSKREKHTEKYAEKEKELAKTLNELMLERLEADEHATNKAIDNLGRVKDARVNSMQEAVKAELDSQRLINEIKAEQLYVEQHASEAADLRAKKVNADESTKSINQLKKERQAFIEAEEAKAMANSKDGELSAENAAKIREQADLLFALNKENIDRVTKERLKQDALAAQKRIEQDKQEARQKELNRLNEGTLQERIQALMEATHDDDGKLDAKKLKEIVGVAMDASLKWAANIAKNLESTIKDIGSAKSAVDTRLHGTSDSVLKQYSDSYWKQLSKDMARVGAINPYFKQADFAQNIRSLVDQGIAFDLEQRAFLMTIQNKIATTFEVADGTLLRLIRIQQEDTTAGRLGMEAALNAFLNEMYANTEYLQQVADSVRGSLAEMQSLMDGAEAAEVEFQVQKWMGSLYSVGMSDAAVNSISTALGQIAAGQLEGLTGDGAGNLLVMAASDAGLSIADILTKGIDSESTNKLLEAVVEYLVEIADSTKDNRVVQQQLAEVFGVKASDLRAATNLITNNSIGAIYDQSAEYTDMVSYLTMMANSMGDRTSISEKMTNIWENVQYSMANGIAQNPLTYFIYQLANFSEGVTGGIKLPNPLVAGTGVVMDTSVEDLLRLGSVGLGILGNLGALTTGLSNSFDGVKMLSQLGITDDKGIAVTPRGDGGGIFSIKTGGGSSSTSGSGYVGNASGSDIKSSTMQEFADDNKQIMIEAKEEAEANELDTLNTTVLKIYELLDDVAHGNGYLRVKVDNYGLTKGSSNAAQGGVAGVNAITNAANSGALGGSISNSGADYSNFGGSISLGGWTANV